MKQALFAVCLAAFFAVPLPAQSHASIDLNDQIYHILEQAEMRGLIAPLSGIRPYPRSVVVRAIGELLDSDNADRLRPTERRILEDHLARLATPEAGLDMRRGGFFAETALGAGRMPLSFNFEFGADFELSSAFIPSFGERHFGAEFWAHLDWSGDIGRNVSYSLRNQAGLINMPRRFLGWYNTYYEGFVNEPNRDYENRVVEVRGEPLTHFPFSYRRRWDDPLFTPDGFPAFALRGWPYDVSLALAQQAELTASFMDNALVMRMGRMRREWGSMPLGSSLIFNQAARPFLAVEAEFRPFSWFSFASLTGVLEYELRPFGGVKDSAMENQNAFSIMMLQFRFRDRVFLDIFDAVVWPRRFELGYLLPIVSNTLYQNAIGDFDNMALGMNIRVQQPGLGTAWVSLFVDELTPQRDITRLDRMMIAYQAGFVVPLPFLAFTSLRFSYTRINPYTYTHNRNFNPWFGGLRMETAWVNNGVGIGHYLPPNSDEFLLQFRTMPSRNVTAGFQYQLIRRGANFGSGAVDGSDLRSELDPNRGGDRPQVWRFFLRDGAYEWIHALRANASWSLPNLPVSFFGEAGVVFSSFTNIDGPPNNSDLVGSTDERPHPRPFRRINTPEYPTSTTFIVRIGFSVFR